MIAPDQALTQRQAGVVIRRLAKEGIEAELDYHSWGSVVTFVVGGARYRIETVGQAHRWTGYPNVEAL